MKNNILLLNFGDEPLLGISFSLQLAKFKPLLHHEPEELINWANLYSDSISHCVLVNGCHRPDELEKLQRLLHSSALELKIIIVGDNTPKEVLLMIEGDPMMIHCTRAELSMALKKCHQRDIEPSTTDNFFLNTHSC